MLPTDDCHVLACGRMMYAMIHTQSNNIGLWPAGGRPAYTSSRSGKVAARTPHTGGNGKMAMAKGTEDGRLPCTTISNGKPVSLATAASAAIASASAPPFCP